eukprot:1585871-Amphidinium_carterae.1
MDQIAKRVRPRRPTSRDSSPHPRPRGYMVTAFYDINAGSPSSTLHPGSFGSRSPSSLRYSLLQGDLAFVVSKSR